MATYYIDTTGVDDAGRNGLTTGTAWATLSYACTRVTNASDTIYVNPGTYTETQQCILAVGVHIMGAGVTSIINSSYSVPNEYSIKLSSAALTDGNQSISYIKLTGTNLTARNAILVDRRSKVSIHHCAIENFIYRGVQFHVNNSIGELNPIYVFNNSFYKNVLTNCAGWQDGAGGWGALSINGQSTMKIYDNIITQSRALGQNGPPIKGVNGINKDIKIYNNYIYMPAFASPEHYDFAIELWDCRGGVEVYDNYCEGSIDIGGRYNMKNNYDYTVWIHDNIFQQNDQSLSEFTRGIVIEAHYKNEDIIYERNYVKNTCMGCGIGSAVNDTIFKNIRISYNIFESIGLSDSRSLSSKGWGMFLNDNNHTQTFDNFEVYNNVFTAKVGTFSTMWGLQIPPMVSTNIKFRNNIIRYFDFACLYGKNGGDALITCDILSIENNIFINNGNTNLPRYEAGFVPTNNTTQNNLTSDPLFIGGSPYSYALQSNSPAIDAGLDVGLVSDFIGTLVPYGSAPDIGAYEWFEVVYDFTNITLVNTPACYNAVDNSIISRWVATECPINFTLLRRDWYITNSADIGGFLAISVYGTFSGNDGDVISVYDLTTNSMYTGTITDSSGDPILITDIPYVAGMDIKYLNDHTLYAGYYFEGRLTINGVVESLTVIASPDSFGYADLDVSGILRIKTSIGKVTNYLSLIQKDTNKSGKFTLEYRGCWYGSNEAYIPEGSQTSPASEVIWYYAECVRSEEQGCNLAEYVPTDLNDAPFLNQFDTPVYWYGLPFDLSFILPERAELSPTSDIIVTMKVYNSANVQMGADIVQTIDVDSLEGYVNSLNIDSTLIDAGAAYFTVEIFSM